MNTKEMRANLKARVKSWAAAQKGLRLEKVEAKAAGRRVQSHHEKAEFEAKCSSLHWMRHDCRDDNRHCLLAYAFIKGRTYKQAENKCREGNEPDGGSIGYFLNTWVRLDDADLAQWIEEGDKTRFDLMPEPEVEETEETPKVFEAVSVDSKPANPGFLARLLSIGRGAS